MNKMSARLVTLPLALILGVAAVSGCSEDSQEKYNDAIKQLKEARESRNEAQEQLKSKKEELAELQAALDNAQSKLKQAGQNVDNASQAVNKTVNDEVLFRTIQRALLDKKNFDQAAISVGVQNRVVTLTGNVPDEDTHQQALKIARSQAGVKNVVDSLAVRDKQSAPDHKKDAKKDHNASGGSQSQAHPENPDAGPNPDSGQPANNTQDQG